MIHAEKLTSNMSPDLKTTDDGSVGAGAARRGAGDFLLGSGIVLAVPHRLVRSAWIGHIPFAYWVVDALRPRSFVELGTYSGCSYAAFLQAITALRLASSCYAVDTWKGDAHSGFYGEDIYQELAAYHDSHYGSFSRLLRMTFDEARVHFSDGTIDLIHIDGFHTYEAVSHDVQAWLPKASSRGLVLIHDINARERNFGVWRCWEELSAKYPSFAFLHCHGLGVAWVGTEPMPEPIAWLMELANVKGGSGDVEIVRNYFNRLGSGLIDQFASGERNKAIRERDEILRKHDETLRERDEAVRTRDEALRERDLRITDLAKDLAEARKYWGLGPIVHAPGEFSRFLRGKHPTRRT